jgi:hypothetical protein
MAKMWPRQIPNWVAMDRRRAAEIKVFEKLAASFDDSWSIFYSRPWYGISASGGEIEGEADFIIANSEIGIFFLEVKGGQISFDPLTSNWSSVDRNDIKFKIKDPIDQAKKCRYQFAKKLERQEGWPKGFINFKYGAVLPDTLEPSPSLNSIGGHDKKLFCHAAEFESNFESWIVKRMGVEGEGKTFINPGKDGLIILESLIAEPVNLKASVGTNVHEDLFLMDQLFTGAQLQIALSLQSMDKVVISGGAGTGKTLLAAEMAIFYNNLELNTLVVTCSNPLSSHLRVKLTNFKNVSVMTLEDALANKGFSKYWDAIVIDEAQDVPWELWNQIEGLLVPNGRLLAFMDSNQSVYRPTADLSTLLGAKTYELNINLRNTRQIAKSTESLYQGPLVHAPGPVGHVPMIIDSSSLAEAIEYCANLIFDLTVKDSVKRNEIVILCRDKKTREKIQFELSERNILSTNSTGIGFDVIRVETVPLFKGLESPVVIAICDSEWANNMEMSYVSISRARSRFYLIGNVKNTLLQSALEKTYSTLEEF